MSFAGRHHTPEHRARMSSLMRGKNTGWKHSDDARERMSRSKHPRWLSGMTLEEYFWSLGERRGECLIWTGRVMSNGYGQFCCGQLYGLAHVLAFQFATGEEVLVGNDVHHACEVQLCIEPGHLEHLTKLEHAARHRRPAIYTRELT